MSKCTVETCEKERFRSSPYCTTHFMRHRRHGDPMVTVSALPGQHQQFLAAAIEADTDECVIWPYGKYRAGYAAICIDNKPMAGHRYICTVVHGPAPDGLHAAHSCGQASCINPKHLRWATRKENEADKRLHGRDYRGDRFAVRRLKPDQVLEIRSRLERGEADPVIAADYGVKRGAIRNIRLGRAWLDV